VPTYVGGTDVGYYLSDITGSVDVTGGTILWRATRPTGTSTWTPDTQWSLVNTNVARCNNVTSLAFDDNQALYPANSVNVTITASYTQGKVTSSYSQVRDVYLEDHN
jgi:hypothetical protein